MVERGQGRLGFGLGEAEVGVGSRGCLASAGGADDQFAAKEVGFHFFLDGVDGDLEGRREGVDTGGSAFEEADEGVEVAAVLFVEAFGVDFLHVEGVGGDGLGDVSIGAGEGEVADPAETGVGQAGSATAASGEFAGGGGVDGDAKFGGIGGDDAGEVVDVVELEVFVHVEAVAEWSREHAAAGGGADDGEAFEGEVDGAGSEALTEDDIHAEVFHDRVEEFFDGAREAVDFVDEEDRAFGGVGEEGEDVGFFVECGAGGDGQVDAEFVVENGGEGGFAEAGGAIEEDVGQGFAAEASGVEGDGEAFGDRALADDFGEGLGAQLVVGMIGSRR